PFVRGVAAQPQNRLQQVEGGAGSPGLRHVRLAVQHRERPRAALHARVQLREPVADEVAGSAGDVAGDTSSLAGEAVALEAERNDPVVVWPNRAAVIRERVEGRALGG